MNIALKILDQPCETDFNHNERTNSFFVLMAISIGLIMLLPSIESTLISVLRYGLAFSIFVYSLNKVQFKKADEILSPHFIGKLVFNEAAIVFETDMQKAVVESGYAGLIKFKFEGYHGEVEGFGRNPNYYYGTNNTIELVVKDFSSKYYVYLNGTVDKQKFFTLIKWCYEQGLDCKEFTRGMATYQGKQLNYREIKEFKNRNKPKG